MRIDADTAVVVCAGPSLDLLTEHAWRDLAAAGAIVGVNGAPAAVACRKVPFTCLAAMDLELGLAEAVPNLRTVWRKTPAWRVASADSQRVDAESYVHEVDEADGVEGWSDDRRQGYKGGSSAMVIGNWLGNEWDEPAAMRNGRTPPRRAFRKLAYIGLDMHPGRGAHARGAGAHASGFARSDAQYGNVCRGWSKFCAEAAKRGIEVVNLSPGTALEAMPRAAVPKAWVR
ncbi:MAG TPA: hypothetical protein VGR02_19315 [Thermoanaerobaculia bacterium]|jgi:hypothetical protein|nr:hypothetical protein [Thermoanaerobaculia bacterium]